MSQAITTPEEVMDAITAAEKNAPTKKSKKSKKQPLKARPKRKLNYGEEGPPKQRVRTVSKKKMKQLQAATNQFQPMEEASEDEDNDEDEESQSLLPEESQLAETQVVASDDDGSNNDDDDEDDVTAITAVFQNKGDDGASDSDKSSSSENSDSDEASEKASHKEKSMPEQEVIDLSGGSDDDAAVDVHEFDQSQRVDARDHMEPQIDDENEVVVDDVKQRVTTRYNQTFAVDAETLYEWAQQYFPKKDINAFMNYECDNDDRIAVGNTCYTILAAMVTNKHEGGSYLASCYTLMMIFIAELLKNVDSKWTGIQKAYEQIKSDPYESYVTEFIRDNGEEKDLKTKALSRVLHKFYETIDEHGKLPEFKQIYDQVWGKDTEEESDAPKIKSILRNHIASDEAFDYLKGMLEVRHPTDCEGNVLLFWPLDELYATVNEADLRATFEMAWPKPELKYEPTMEADELLNAHKILQEKLKRHEKRVSEMISHERKKAKSQCFLRKLVEATITILDCCEEKGDESWETIQDTIQELAQAFADRSRNTATEDIQGQCKLGWYKLAMYQNMYAQKKMKLQLDDVPNYKCDFGAALTFMKKKSLFYNPDRERKKGDFYTLKKHKQWASKINRMQLPEMLTREQKGKKNLYLPRPLLEDGRTAREKVSLEKRIDYLFATLHFASLSHCLMDRTAFYNSRYYNGTHHTAYPTYRMNAAFQALSKVYVSASELKK